MKMAYEMLDDARLEALARQQYERADAGFALDAAHTALIMIDMQAEFLSDDAGPMRVPAARSRIPAMQRLLRFFREQGMPVVHTAFAATHQFLDRPKYGERMPNRASAMRPPNDGLFRDVRFAEELRPHQGEVVLLKPSYGAFYDTPLETILRRLEIETVVLAGTLTDCCVGTTARQAYERGFGAVVVEDATATSLEAMHVAELSILRRAFARVLSTAAVIDELRLSVPELND